MENRVFGSVKKFLCSVFLVLHSSNFLKIITYRPEKYREKKVDESICQERSSKSSEVPRECPVVAMKKHALRMFKIKRSKCK